MPQLSCLVTGTVIRGFRFARTTGFPTANLSLASFPNLGHGVYAAYARIGEREERFPSVVFFGVPYSIEQASERFEVHLLDEHRELYGASLSVELLHLLRRNKRFSSAEELQDAIEKDIAETRLFFSLRGHV